MWESEREALEAEYWSGYGGVAEADRQYAHAVGAERPEREWICSDRDVWYRNPYYTGPVGPHPEDPEPPWTPDPGAELLGFNLREVGFHLHGLALAKDAEVRELARFVSDDDLPF